MPNRSAKHGASARNKVKATVPTAHDVKPQKKKMNGRFSSQASAASAGLSLRRKTAFDDETTAGDESFLTSTTDYLHGKEAKSRNLHASFDSQDSPMSPTERKQYRMSAGGSQTSEGSGFSTLAREKKRLQERAWQHDRQQKGQRPQTNSSYEPPNVSAARYDDSYGNSSADMEPLQPQSSRQLGTTGLKWDQTGRDGYDSDSYSLKASKKSANTRRSFLQESQTGTSGYADSTLEDAHGRKSVASHGDSFMVESEGKIKMTKMEKIKQLQEKNERYKEEYKKTYLEKKEFKKKYDDKKMEITSLTSEIESYMRETALLKQQLSVVTSDMDHAEDGTRNDLALVAKLQKELQETRSDLKEALGRIAERKMISSKLEEIMKRKDAQIETLTLEVSRQIQELQNFQAQVAVQDMGSTASAQIARAGPSKGDPEYTNGRVKELKDENETIKAELEVTLNRAAEMVKNREGIIEILRQENLELKELLDIRDQDGNRTTVSDKLQAKEDAMEALRIELAGLKELFDEHADDEQEMQQVIKSREVELRHLEGDIDGLKKMVKKAEKEAQKARKEAEERELAITALKAKLTWLENQSKGTEKEFEKATEVVEGREEQIRRLEDEVKLLKEGQDDSCEKLDTAHAHLEEKEEEIKTLYRENEDLKAEMLQQRDALEARRKTVALELEELKLTELSLNERAKESAQKIKARDDAIEDLLKEVEKLKNSRVDKDTNYSKEMTKHEENLVTLMRDTEDYKLQLQVKDEALESIKKMVKEREDAIEDLLRDIESLKEKGSNGNREVSDRAEKMKMEIKEGNAQVEELQNELDELTKRLDETEYNLSAKTDTIQEREEEVEALLQEISDLKFQHEHELQENERTGPGANTEELQSELSKAKKLVKSKEDELRQLVQENMKLNERMDDLKKEKEDSQTNEDQDEVDQDDSKSYLIAQQEVLEEEIQQLHEQVNDLQEELEDVHRQNSILNEEVEDWLQRGGNLELEIQRLKNEIEEWEDQAELLNSKMARDVNNPDFDMASVGGHSTGELGDKQAMLLENAMAERHRRNGGDGKGVWGLIFNKSNEDEELTEDQKRIKELEAIKDAQAAEIQKIKSDLVKLTTASRNEAYVSKKQISDLEEANDAYKAKVHLLLKRVAESQGIPWDDGPEEKKVGDP